MSNMLTLVFSVHRRVGRPVAGEGGLGGPKTPPGLGIVAAPVKATKNVADLGHTNQGCPLHGHDQAYSGH